MNSRHISTVSSFVAAVLIAMGAATSHAVSKTNASWKLWQDPVFQKQFMGTYGVQAEIEPGASPSEREAMEKVIEWMGTPDGLDAARDFLEGTIQPGRSAVFDFTLANIYFQLDELDQAVEGYLGAIEKFPSYQRAHKNLGLVQVRRGVFEQAVTALTRAIELGAADGLTYGLLGYAYLMSERHLSAEGAYRQAMMLQPETVDWKTGLARCFLEQSKYADAASLCDELVKDGQGSAEVWLLQANAYLGLEQPMQAAANYEYLDLAGEATLQSLNNLGDIYVNAGLMDRATDAYLRALGEVEDEPMDLFLRDSNALVARGAYEEAGKLLAAVKTAFGDAPGDEERKRMLKLEARLAVAGGAAGEDQAKVLRELVDLDPLDGEALILLARHHAGQGEHEQAYFLFERAAGLEAYAGEALLRHGQTLVRQGRYQEALPLLRKAQEIRPRDDVARYLEQVERVARTGS